MTPLDRLSALGPSGWIDGLVPPSELEQLVQAGVTGLTSNPTIFAAAVLESGGYGGRVMELGDRLHWRSTRRWRSRTSRCGGHAAPIFARTHRTDGFVSLEVAPGLADDVTGTVAGAHRLWSRIDRPNAMIKIPGTTAGVEATRRLTADGSTST